MRDADIYGEPDDHDPYIKFTGKQRLETAMHTLHGLLQGLSADQEVNDIEVKALIEWVSRHQGFEHRHPFNEVLPAIRKAITDGMVSSDDRDDMLWLTEKLVHDTGFYDSLTADIQQLHGFMAGIIADEQVSTAEVKSLANWIDEHTHLRTCWPYDEIDAIVLDVLKDGKVDATEEQILLNYFSDFTRSAGHKAVGSRGADVTLSGICAACPEIAFVNKVFCFTGTSERGARSYVSSVVESHGGTFNKNLVNKTDYLVVGAAGNPFWAYACYGRKVEAAIDRRKNGQRVLVVHEHDFWDAVEDAGADA